VGTSKYLAHTQTREQTFLHVICQLLHKLLKYLHTSFSLLCVGY